MLFGGRTQEVDVARSSGLWTKEKTIQVKAEAYMYKHDTAHSCPANVKHTRGKS